MEGVDCNGDDLHYQRLHSTSEYVHNGNSQNNQNEIIEKNNSTHKEQTIEHCEKKHDFEYNKQFDCNDAHNNESTSRHFQYNRSKSTGHEQHQKQLSTIRKCKSLSDDPVNNETNSIHKNLLNNRSMIVDSTNNNFNDNTSSVEERKFEDNENSPIVRLLKPTCEGIRERIQLLGELLWCKKLDSIPDVYDEMEQIIAATQRNERLQTGHDGERLLELTTRAKSNLNIDLYHLDDELQRQFGLHSVEVVGDGACAFRATLISGMQQSDVYHTELRENAVKQVLDDIPYYSTVLRPGETVSDKELNKWADNMIDPNAYGDEMANIAVADQYHIQLVVFRAGELLTVVNPRDGYVQHTAFLVNVGTHYKALVPQHQLEEARSNSERLCK